MPKLRVFEKFGVRVWFLDEEEGQRELTDRIGHLPGPVDWEATAETCRVLGDGEGIEIEFVFREEGTDTEEEPEEG